MDRHFPVNPTKLFPLATASAAQAIAYVRFVASP